MPGDVTALILAAGVGKRLGSDAPKVLLDFDGQSLLRRHLTTLAANGVTDIAITVGHQSALLRDALARMGATAIRIVENPDYRTGSLVSLAVQGDLLRQGRTLLLMDGDVLYDRRMIRRLLDAAPANVLLFDRDIEAGDEPVKICLKADRIVDFRKRPEHAHDRHGESVGFFRFGPDMARRLADRAQGLVAEGATHLEYEEAIRDLILAEPDAFGIEDISDLPWTEIDFPEDVARARLEILPQLDDR